MSSTSATSPITLGNFTGIDFNEIISAETAAMQVPITDLQNQLTTENTAISTLGTIGGDFTTLQTALENLNTSSTVPPMAATTSSDAPFSASVVGGPTAGTYTVNVNQLASAESVASQGYSSDSDTVGTGTITITSGGTPTSITIDSSNDTLDGVAAAINSSGANVNAQVVDTGEPGAPYRLEITSEATGTANAFTVTSSLSGGTSPDFTDNEIGAVDSNITGTATASIGGAYTGSLSQGYYFTVESGGNVGSGPITIGYTSDSGEQGTITIPADYVAGQPIAVADGLTLSLSSGTLNNGDSFSVGTFVPQLSAAQDAQVQVGNQVVTSSTNEVSNAIPGVMLALNNTGGPATVNVAADQTAQGNQISAVVSAYNTVLNDINTNTQEIPNEAAPALADDGGLRSELFEMQFSIGNVNLSELGITINQQTGALSFDQATFAEAQDSDPTAVNTAMQQLYSALNPAVTNAVAPTTGIIATETSSDQTQANNLTSEISTDQAEVQQQTEELQAQYATLQSQIASYQNLEALFTDDSSSSTTGTSTSSTGSNLTISA